MTPETAAKIRKAIYGLVAAVLPLLTLYGVLDESAAAVWASAITGAVTALLALWNVPSDSDPVEERRYE